MYSNVFWQHPAMFCLYTVPTHNLSFPWKRRWWDRIQAIFVSLFYFYNKTKRRRYETTTLHSIRTGPPVALAWRKPFCWALKSLIYSQPSRKKCMSCFWQHIELFLWFYYNNIFRNLILEQNHDLWCHCSNIEQISLRSPFLGTKSYWRYVIGL